MNLVFIYTRIVLKRLKVKCYLVMVGLKQRGGQVFSLNNTRDIQNQMLFTNAFQPYLYWNLSIATDKCLGAVGQP